MIINSIEDFAEYHGTKVDHLKKKICTNTLNAEHGSNGTHRVSPSVPLSKEAMLSSRNGSISHSIAMLMKRG